MVPASLLFKTLVFINKMGALYYLEYLSIAMCNKRGASYSWASKEGELDFSHCQARKNREKWASFPPFYTPLPHLRRKVYITSNQGPLVLKLFLEKLLSNY